MKFLITLILILSTVSTGFGQDINIGKRDVLHSEILNQDRELSIYFPPNYHSSINQTYPVLYILDGDYNFNYVAGLLELEGGISERIPEMILVAISGKGSETYRENCKPNIEGVADKGNADIFANFLSQELIPHINSTYKSNGFDILAGHSIGGLFVINTALTQPKSFDRFIAISPALWWAGNAINVVAQQNPDFDATVYISLANEYGMGIDSFLAVATSSWIKSPSFMYGFTILMIVIAIVWGFKRKKILQPILLVFASFAVSAYLFFYYFPQNENFKFKQFAKENHNSVGEPTYR